MNPCRLQNKRAVVTGSDRGIGLAIAELFAQQGAVVAGLDRDPLRPGTVDCDIADAARVQQAIGAISDRIGGIDILVNNAGVNVFSAPMELDDSQWARCLDVNLKGAWNLCRAVLPIMLARGAGSIVNIASVHAQRIIPGCFPYPVAKHGLIGLTRALGIEYAARGIRVNSISPGMIATPQVEAWFLAQPDPEAERRRQAELLPCKRIGRPEEVAQAALFLASDEAPFINATDLLIDGGRSQLYHD